MNTSEDKYNLCVQTYIQRRVINFTFVTSVLPDCGSKENSKQTLWKATNKFSIYITWIVSYSRELIIPSRQVRPMIMGIRSMLLNSMYDESTLRNEHQNTIGF